MDFVDRSLIKKAQSGDTSAFTELINLYKDKIFNLAFRMLGNMQEAEDISQETFLRVYTNIHSYDEQYKFSTWIYRIATNLCIDRIRKKKADFSLDDKLGKEDSFDWHSIVPNQNRGPEEEVLLSEQQRQIHQAIIELPPKYRTIMVLRYIQDLSITEISKVVGISEATIKTRLHRGREYFRKKLIANQSLKEGSLL